MSALTNIRLIPALILLSFIAVLVFWLKADDHYSFQNRTYKGITEMGTLVTFSLTVEDGLVTGYGAHVFSSGHQNPIQISGYIDDATGEIRISENYTATGSLFGRISGRIDEDFGRFVGSWTNSQGGDQTALNLVFSEYSPEYIINTEAPKRTEQRAVNTGRNVREAVRGFFRGLTSD